MNVVAANTVLVLDIFNGTDGHDMILRIGLVPDQLLMTMVIGQSLWSTVWSLLTGIAPVQTGAFLFLGYQINSSGTLFSSASSSLMRSVAAVMKNNLS